MYLSYVENFSNHMHKTLWDTGNSFWHKVWETALPTLSASSTNSVQTKLRLLRPRASENLSQFQKYFQISHANEWCNGVGVGEGQMRARWGQRDGWWQQRLGKLIACRTFSGSLRSTWFMDKSWEVTHPTLTLTMTSAEECRQGAGGGGSIGLQLWQQIS